MDRLLGADADVNKPKHLDGVTALFIAAKSGHRGVVGGLLGAGAQLGLWLSPLGLLLAASELPPLPAAWCSPVEPRQLVVAVVLWRVAAWVHAQAGRDTD